MRVSSVSGTNYAVRNSAVRSARSSNVSSINRSAAGNLVKISFTGAPMNMNQIASLTPENNGIRLAETTQGGEGCVGFELVKSLRDKEHLDARSFMPYWEYNNPKGGHKFLLHPLTDFPDGVLPNEIPDKYFYSANVGETLEDVAKKNNLKPSEVSYVIQSRPNGNGPEALSKYCIVEPTSAKGEIKVLSDTVLGELKTVPYQLMKVSQNNPPYIEIKGEPHYFLYTPDLAKTAKPYSYDFRGNGSFGAEIINSDEMKVLAKVITEDMNTEEFGYFRPASVIAHDRVAHPFASHIANMSARGNDNVNGIKIHIVEHNPGRNYQGLTSNPFEFLRIVGDEKDAEFLKAHPKYEILAKAQRVGIDNADALTPKEMEIAKSVIEPALAPFKDGSGMYNIVKSGIVAAKTNPENVSVGTVSYNFDLEMKSPETPNAATFLTEDFASIETKSVLNGSRPASLRLDDPAAPFGRGNNGLTVFKSGFTTFKYDGSNIDEVIAAREKNAKWLTSLIDKAHSVGPEELNKVFFNEVQLSEGQKVHGYLKKMKDGDILVMGWGRPDEQKGFNITLDGFKKYLENEDIPYSQKKKFRLALGAGKWNEDAKDYKNIVRLIDEIEALDGGKYKGQVMYVDGFFPNRLVGCAQYGMFTSRREMCGITPLECKAAGVPYGATKTGGPVDYTNDTNGFLTKEPVEGRPERYGLTWENSLDEIDDARCARQAEQVSDIFIQMADEHTNKHDSYVAKCKKNIEEKIDWHENVEYNHGKSANHRYTEDILETDKGWDSRNKSPMKRLMDKFGEFQDKAEVMLKKSAKSRPMKIVFGLIGLAAVGTGAYLLYKNKNPKKLDKAA
jgi:hypothetical protein